MSKVSLVKYLLLVLACSLSATPFLSAEEEPRQSWAYGGIEYVLPRPASQIIFPTDIPEIYEIVSGDTLWGIADKFLKDPFLWPVIWDLNLDKVPNPHLIFPKQIIRLPVPIVIPEEKPAQRITEGPRMVPLVSRSMLIKSGYISPVMPSGPKIIGSEEPIYELSIHDIIYLDAGANQGVLPGDVYIATHVEREVYHPVTNVLLGYMINHSGLIQVIATQEDTSTAMITESFAATHIGDFITRYTEEPIPLTTGLKRVDKFAPQSGKLPGYIVDTIGGAVGVSGAIVLGAHDVVYIDLGSDHGVLPGDSFIVYLTREKLRAEDYDKFWWEKKKGDKLPPIVEGALTVFRVKENTATAVITKSIHPIFIGDAIQLRE